MSGIRRVVAASAVSVFLLVAGVETTGGSIGVPITRVELSFVEGCSGTGTMVIDNVNIVGRVDRIDVSWSPSMPIRATSLLLDDSAPSSVQLLLDDGTLVYAAMGVPGADGFEVLATLDCSTIPYAVVSGLPNTSVGSGPGPLPIALMLFVVAGIIAAWAFARSRRPRPRLAS